MIVASEFDADWKLRCVLQRVSLESRAARAAGAIDVSSPSQGPDNRYE